MCRSENCVGEVGDMYKWSSHHFIGLVVTSFFCMYQRSVPPSLQSHLDSSVREDQSQTTVGGCRVCLSLWFLQHTLLCHHLTTAELQHLLFHTIEAAYYNLFLAIPTYSSYYILHRLRLACFLRYPHRTEILFLSPLLIIISAFSVPFSYLAIIILTSQV